jgi:elongation factor G
MQGIDISKVRNFVLMGHTHSGKTTIIDDILFKQGINSRHGSVDDGTSMADYTDTEKNRNISIWAKPFDIIYKRDDGEKFNLVIVDTPGYADFVGQSVMAAHVADSAVITVDAVDGIQVGTNRAWRQCEQRRMPRAIAITAIDKDNADFDAMVEQLRSVWGEKCIPVTIPSPDGESIVDVLECEDIPEALKDRMQEYKTALVEHAAETDDSLIEKYLEGEALTREEITNGLRGAVQSGDLVPVFALSAKKDLGCDELLQDATRLFPSPIDVPSTDAAGEELDCRETAPFSGLVWRTTNDPFVGSLCFVRIYSGILKADSEVFNSSKGEKERIGALLVLNGKQQEKVEQARSGDIVAIAKLKHTSMNDSLCAIGSDIKLKTIEFPKSVVSYAVYPKSSSDEDKLGEALRRVTDDDPTLIESRNDDTHELVLSGMGDVQLQVAVENMKQNSNVEVDLRTPKIAYKETIRSQAEGHHKHKKQSGGHGQFGEVYLRVEPRDPSDEEWFVDAIVGGAIPSGFMTAVEKGLKEGLEKGSLAKFPVTNVKITVYDGSYHTVDSSEVAFKLAASRALHEALEKASPVLLEPIMKIRVHVPDEYMGDISGDLNHKRGRILGMGLEDGMQVIEANVPQSEVFQYSSQLRSLTGGRGSFELEFDRYDIAPSDVTQRVVAAHQEQASE